MRIGIHDPTGCALGIAIGCVELGHEVVFDGPPQWRAAAAGMPRLLGELAVCAFGAGVGAVDPGDCDLVVVAEVFGDFLAGFAPFLAGDRGAAATPAWLLEYPARLRRALELATTRTPAVVIDYGDVRDRREAAFETIGGVTLLARECALEQPAPWRPFPFLFHNGVLWMQRMRPRPEWWIPPAQRRRAFDWTFCGTVDHPRYGGRRTAALAAIRRRLPALRGDVCEGAPFAAVVARLQAAGVCLDLPGAGELCFRLHEALTLGVPVWRPDGFAVHVAPGLDGVIAAEPSVGMALDPLLVGDVAERCYSPRAAARALLTAAAVGPTTATPRVVRPATAPSRR